MRRLLFAMASCCCLLDSHSALFGAKIKGGVQRLIDTVVDVIVPKIDEDMDGKPQNLNGSGFIISEDGYIVTNCHVVDPSDNIKVVIYDGTEYQAKIVGRDERSDIALLKIDVDPGVKLPCAQFADSDKVEICDPVIAIGNPLSLGKSVTGGMVSFKGRNLSDQILELGASGDLVAYIQFDASVNYGNSGGPLFSENGEVIGMVTVFVTDGLHSTGINFAIPSNMLKKVIKQLRTYGKMRRSWLGISVCRMAREASKLLLENNVGYYVTSVSDDSPAKSVGIQVGDIILEINKEGFSENTNVEYLLNNLPIGAVIPLQIMRDGKKRMLSVTVGSRNDEDFPFTGADEGNNKDIPSEKIAGLGLGGANLTKELREIFKISSHENGVLISSTDSGLSPDLGIGNLIKKVNQKEVRNLKELNDVLSHLPKSKSKKPQKIVLYVWDPLTRKSSYVVVECKK